MYGLGYPRAISISMEIETIGVNELVPRGSSPRQPGELDPRGDMKEKTSLFECPRIAQVGAATK